MSAAVAELVFAVCRHCHLEPGVRRRGLCRRCWDQPAVRERYACLRMGRPPLPRAGTHQPCRHCGVAATVRARGLCYHCWGNPEVRELYFARSDGLCCGNHRRPPPTEPTGHLPGTPGKVAALAARAAADVGLWHSQDAKGEG